MLKPERWLFLPTLRARDILFLSAGVTLGVVVPLAGVLLGQFDGYWNCITGLMMFLLGLTPWFMEWFEERLRKERE